MASGDQPPEKSKRKFKPGPPPPPRQRTAPTNNTEAAEEADNRRAARHITRSIGQGRAKAETKAAVEVAFQPSSSSNTIRSFGVPKKEEDNRVSDVVEPSSSSAEIVSSGTPQNDGEEVRNLVTRSTKGGYVEPWDHEKTYYPYTVLPWREPDSGDPELLDQEEFGEVATHPDFDESKINSAEELGLTVEQPCDKQMFLFKFPDGLNVMKRRTGANTKKSPPDYSKRSNPFEDFSGGLMGKMLVYKSGAVKMKLGDVLYDVSPGLDTNMQQDMAMINTKAKTCCSVGSSAKSVTVTPDVKSLLNSAADTDTQK